MEQDEEEKTEYEKKIKNRVIRYLESQGYQVSINVQRQGKSGILHSVLGKSGHRSAVRREASPEYRSGISGYSPARSFGLLRI